MTGAYVEPEPLWASRGRALHWHRNCQGLRGIAGEPQPVLYPIDWLEKLSDRHWCHLCYRLDRADNSYSVKLGQDSE